MRLLNTTTLQLEEFFGNDIPSYAILSHRWAAEEVTFQDLRDGREVTMAGYSKIAGCCQQAMLDGHEHVWIDSCCIDKSSSAELSEAINSMFKWYRNAQVCYAYLSDVEGESTFAESKWFTRGWTLQELLAPDFLVFFNSHWNEIGTKMRMRTQIESITGITHLLDFEAASVAQKMSWASKRKTTRVEDQAYCLMGLFGINMPPLYGEGEGAFLRLQLEILRTSDDESIFAWTSKYGTERQAGLLLAHSVTAFERSGDIVLPTNPFQRASYAVTNKGLRIDTILLPVSDDTAYGEDIRELVMPLNCVRRGQPGYLAIYVERLFGDQFERILTDELKNVDEGQPASISEQIDVLEPDPGIRTCYFKQRQSRGCEKTTVSIDMRILQFGYQLIRSWPDSDELLRETGVPNNFLLVLSDNEANTTMAALYFAGPFMGNSEIHQFAVVFNLEKNRPGIDIICRPNHLLIDNMDWWANKGDRPRLDKLSVLLPSGVSVLAKMRKSKSVWGSQSFAVDVDMDLDGWLPWPDPDLSVDPPKTLSPIEGYSIQHIEDLFGDDRM